MRFHDERRLRFSRATCANSTTAAIMLMCVMVVAVVAVVVVVVVDRSFLIVSSRRPIGAPEQSFQRGHVIGEQL